jgi:hypothetical protein
MWMRPPLSAVLQAESTIRCVEGELGSRPSGGVNGLNCRRRSSLTLPTASDVFLFDPCAFPQRLTTSCWSLNPALHDGIHTAMISPLGRHGLSSRAWRHGTRCCCSRSWGRCCCGSRSASCCRCCSKRPREARATSRTFYAECRTRFLPPNTAARKRQLSAWLT